MKKLSILLICIALLAGGVAEGSSTTRMTQKLLGRFGTNHLPSIKKGLRPPPSQLKSAPITTVALDSITSDGQFNEIFTYNADGTTSEMRVKFMDPDINLMVDVIKFAFAYDTNGYNTEQFISEYEQENWKLINKSIFTNNINGDVTQQMDYVLNPISGIWMLASDALITYDDNGLCLRKEGVFYDANTNEVTNRSLNTYEYDNTGNITSDTYSEWYPSQDKLKGILIEYIKVSNIAYTYSLSKQLTSEIDSNWDDLNQSWEATDKISYTYDQIGNLTDEIAYTWNGNLNDWIVATKDEYSYNNNYTFEEMILPFKNIDGAQMNMYLNHMVLLDVTTDWDDVNETFIPNSTTNFHYSPFIPTYLTKTTSNTELQVVIKNNQVVVSGITLGDVVTVYNLQGTAVCTQKANSESTTIDLPTKSVYLVRVGSKTIKVVN